MKHVELIRGRILRGFAGELARLRIFISATEGNQEAVDKLRGEPGDTLLAKVTDIILQELGHTPERYRVGPGASQAVPVESADSHIRRAVAKLRKPK